jgi:hypothetical protein
VQLAGDAQSLLDGSAPCGLVSGPLRFFGTLLDLAKVQLPDAGRHHHDPAEMSQPAA